MLSQQNFPWVPEEANVLAIVEFILKFSRLEYALKSHAEFSGSLRGHFQANWPRLTEELQRHPIPTALESALEYFKQAPPMKQTSSKDWEPIRTNSDWELLIKSLKTVRNNLFHGGKHYSGPLLEPARDIELIQLCLTVIDEVVAALPSNVRKSYENG